MAKRNSDKDVTDADALQAHIDGLLESQEEEILARYGNPEEEKKESLFRFFRDILSLPESWKVGNIKKDEIGIMKLSVRSNLELAQYAEVENMDIVQDFFINKARIISETSMGREGFFLQTAITQIKKQQTMRELPRTKSGLFGKKEAV